MSLLLKPALQQGPDFQNHVAKDVIIEIATNILHSLNVTNPIYQEELLHKIDTLDPTALCEYFNENDQKHVGDLTNVVFTCVKDLVEQTKVAETAPETILPQVATAVRKSSVLMNEVHADEDNEHAATPKQTATVLETIFDLVVTAVVPGGQAAVLTVFLEDLFKLVELQLIPLARRNHCFQFCQRA